MSCAMLLRLRSSGCNGLKTITRLPSGRREGGGGEGVRLQRLQVLKAAPVDELISGDHAKAEFLRNVLQRCGFLIGTAEALTDTGGEIFRPGS